MVPEPVTTPSPSTFCSASPKSVERWVTKRSCSTKEPGSSRSCSRSRAVSLPLSCCALTRSGPPPCSDSCRRPASVPSFFWMVMPVKKAAGDRSRQAAGGVAAPGRSLRLIARGFARGCLPRGHRDGLLGREVGDGQQNPVVNGVHLQHLDFGRLSFLHVRLDILVRP